MTFLGVLPASLRDYPGVVVSITDGDTVGATLTILDQDLGFGVHSHDTKHENRWRLAGINAPELSADAGKLAADHLVALLGAPPPPTPWVYGHDPYMLPEPIPVTGVTIKDSRDDYGRYLLTLIRADGVNLNEQMIADGFAVPWKRSA